MDDILNCEEENINKNNIIKLDETRVVKRRTGPSLYKIIKKYFNL